MSERPLQHDELSELLSAYLDGEVTAAEQALVERQLSASAEFRQLHDELRSLRAGIAALPRQKLNPDFADAVLRQAERAMLASPNLKPIRPAGGGPVSLAEAPTPRERIVRGLRAFRWSLAAIAVALLLMLFNPEGEQKQAHVAQVDQHAGEDARPRRKNSGDGKMIAVPRTTDSAEHSAELTAEAPAESPAHAPAPALELAAPIAADRMADKSEGETAAPQEELMRAAPAAPAAAKLRASSRTAAPADAAMGRMLQNHGDEFRGAGARHSYSQESPQYGAAGKKPSGSRENDRQSDGKRNAIVSESTSSDMLIVRCDLSPQAAESHAFERLLGNQRIDVATETPAQAGQPAALAERARQTADIASEEAFLVEATPEQIAAVLAELQARSADFPTVDVQPSARIEVAEEQTAQRDSDQLPAATRRGRAVRVDGDALLSQEPRADDMADEGLKKEEAGTGAGANQTELKAAQAAVAPVAPNAQRVLFLLRVVPSDAPSR